jgi:cell division protein FtsL
MLAAVVVLLLLAVALGVVLGLLIRRHQRRLAYRQRAAIAREQLRAEWQLHQLTQTAVLQMLEAARHR